MAPAWAVRDGRAGPDCARRIAVFVRRAAIVLANAQVYWDERRLTEAMRARATTDYAIGSNMAGGRQSPEEAIQPVLRAAHRENQFRDIAGHPPDSKRN